MKQNEFTMNPEKTDDQKDEQYMRLALKEAMYAFDLDEVPIGCIIVCQDKIIARGYNLVEKLNDFTAHAEMQAYTSASEYLGGKSLEECTLYVTLEPCVMCAGGAYNTRLGRIVFGAYDEKRGYSKFGVHSDNRQGILHPKTKVTGGVLEEDCVRLLREFFASKRNN
jgi:tRNA(adenine34) deaminase